VRGAFEEALGRRRKLLLVGGYGCGNVGDEAILSVLLGELRDLGARVRVVSADAAETRRQHGVEAVSARPLALARALLSCDTLVVGGGGIFSAYMGRRSMKLPALAGIARLLGKRVIFRALGVYGSTPPKVARRLVRAMERATFVSVRDDASVDALEAFGLRREVLREADPATRLKVEPCDTVVPSRSVGLALRRVRDEEQQETLTAAFAQLIDDLVEDGYRPILLPFSEHPSEPFEQDLAYANEVRALTREPARCRVLEAQLRPGQMLGVVRQLDALVGMRFHAIVFGRRASVPTVAVPYDDKCRAFAEEHAMPSVELDHVTAYRLYESFVDALPRVAVAA
jgi:polysaccharide pyruvyl transferase CsaB